MPFWRGKKKKIQNENLYEENTRVFIENFSKLVEDETKETVENLIKFMANSVQGELLAKCFYNDRNYEEYIKHIKYSLLFDLESKDYQECNIEIDISKIPVISCIWNYEQVMNKLGFIFDSCIGQSNIDSYLIEPLGLVVVTSGNHSINSAIINNRGNFIVNKKIDISSILEKYEFNGKDYIDRDTKNKIKSYFLKNDSEPFTYTLGLFFEMARVLKKSKSKKNI